MGGEDKDFEVYANSVFDPEKRGLYIANDVTSKYTNRSLDEYSNLAGHIENIVSKRHGNYMIFCPSYAFMYEVYHVYEEKYMKSQSTDFIKHCIIQKENMSEGERENFLQHFIEGKHDTLLAFCIMGGIFGEGIDLKKDSLIGAIIIGTGLPQICYERELLKEYFDQRGENGFDYAYRYPGMNKVLQAAGRVIRTAQDIGIIALLDNRFLQNSYIKLFPREWNNYECVERDTVGKRIEYFWNSWL